MSLIGRQNSLQSMQTYVFLNTNIMCEDSFETRPQYVSLSDLELAVFLLWPSELETMDMPTQ